MTCKPLSEATGKVMSAVCRDRTKAALQPIVDAIAAGDPAGAMLALGTGELARCLGQWVETRRDELPAELERKGWGR